MKKICILTVLLGICLGLGACAVAEQDVSGVGTQFQEGIQGRGQIVERDPLSDSFGSEFR